MSLPININQLISGKTVEWDRLEFKRGWNPEEIIHSICAFANDINNWGGGYIVVGIAENEGIPELPPVGLSQESLDKIQKELVNLRHQIEPFPQIISEPVKFQGKYIFIIWVPGGSERPYKVPATLGTKGQKRYFVRQGSVSKIVNPAEEKQLLSLSENIPFDDRINYSATINELDKDLLIEFLYAIDSNLYKDAPQMSKEELALRMQLLRGVPEDRHPINAALLFFNLEPHNFFRGAFSEIVLYKDYKGITFTEKTFRGSLFKQIKNVLEYLKSMVLAEKVIKIPGQAEALRIWNYPYEAVEEAVVNAYYHRSYEDANPVEISVYPDKMVILSFPGPLPPIDQNALKQKKVFARNYRNRRIGDFLKELDLTEGRSTGFPIIYDKMERNGSPVPIFETDSIYTHFLTILPVQPEFLKAIQEEEKQKEAFEKMTNHEKVLVLIKANSKITILEMAEKMELAKATVKRILSQLTKDGVIERIGTKKDGERVIVEK